MEKFRTLASKVMPLDRVTETDLTMEQAMSMLMTGGAVGPEAIQYSTARLEANTSEKAIK